MTGLPERFLRLPIAHRALHDLDDGRPENSVAAARAAVAAGYGIEVDVQLTADDFAAVFHDYSLDRLTGETGPLRQRTMDELQAINLADSQETIPSLAQVLAAVDGQVPVLVELKDQDGAMGPGIGALEQAVADDIAASSNEVAVMSFNPHSVARLQELAPQVPRGLITGAFQGGNWGLVPEKVRARLRDIPDFARTGASFVSHGVADLDRARLKELKGRGVPVLCWTVRDAVTEANARQIADNITFEGYLPAIPPA